MSTTARTVRRDVVRLRDLGYPVDTIYGRGGGYRLDAATTLPPLMFDAHEAPSTVLALRAYARAPADPASGSLLRALGQLIGVVPTRLGAHAAAVSAHSSSLSLGMPVGARPVPVDVRSLVTLARACREHRQVSALYRSRLGAARRRQLEPLHLVGTIGRWYL